MFNCFVKKAVVSILDEGLILDRSLADGRPIPAVIIDADGRVDIVEYINAHKTQPPGDVVVQWGGTFYSDKIIVLILKSSRPVEIEFSIAFDAKKNHALIDGIIQNNGFYLFEGLPGDKVSSLMLEKKRAILVEVPSTGFEPSWNNMLLKIIKKRFRVQGLGKRQADEAAKGYIESMRELWSVRKKPQ